MMGTKMGAVKIKKNYFLKSSPNEKTQPERDSVRRRDNRGNLILLLVLFFCPKIIQGL
jgi:hypothetical protein